MRKRPWNDYDHNEKGYFESYLRENEEDSKERLVYNLFSLKDIGFDIKLLKNPNNDYFLNLKNENVEAHNGAKKIMVDIEKHNLSKYIN